MENPTRYAIYFVPDPESDLYRFGASVLGYDCYSGNDLPHLPGAAPDWPDKVRTPRMYGFHATLKPPFRLEDSAALSDLHNEFEAFAASQRAIDVGALAVREIGSFIALVPADPDPNLDRLAADCVRRFDRFRAPLTDEERARRVADPLTDRQRAHVERWGYPYVFEDFRFHMTLSGSLPTAERPAILRWLKEQFAGSPSQTSLVDRLALVEQATGPFRVIRASSLKR